MYLSVIVPAYNEAPALRAGKLDIVRAWLAAQPFTAELLVVDDGSEDDTALLARRVADRVIRIPHAGKAAAIIAGIEAADGTVVLFTDMDQATPIASAVNLLAALDAGADIAIGSRGLRRREAPVGRLFLSWGQVVVRTLLLGLPWPDTQCGFKAFTGPAARDVLDHLRVYHPARGKPIRGASVTSGFDVEFLYVARRRGYRIAAVPVDWHFEQTRRVDLRRDAWRGVRDLLAILVARWRGAYRAGAPHRAMVVGAALPTRADPR
ncbi:MAG TPA: glycosyltransferase [Rubricoccaceae bacterium]|nr:glycosyltransferase [Rubricoccaceae bacterium]